MLYRMKKCTTLLLVSIILLQFKIVIFILQRMYPKDYFCLLFSLLKFYFPQICYEILTSVHKKTVKLIFNSLNALHIKDMTKIE